MLSERSRAKGTAWRGRTEHYLTDPSKEPDPAKWEVDVACLTSQVPAVLGVLLLGRWVSGAPPRSERGPGRPRRNHRHRGSGEAPR